MKKIFLFSLILSITLTSCKKEAEKIDKEAISNSFNELLDNYNEESYKLFPLNATFAGDNR